MAQFGTAQKIVIVEDNYALSDIYKTRLEMLGYTVFTAYDGVQALSVIEKELPDLVLLDLMVPKIAGDQVLERMRESDWGKHIKVMIISNLNEAEAPAGLRNLGIEGYAVKANLNNDQLDKLVEVILKPAGQVEDVVLAHTEKPEIAHAEPSPPPDIQAADPLSGTSLQTNTNDTAIQPPASDEYIDTAEPASSPASTAADQADPLAYSEPADTFAAPEPASPELSPDTYSDQPSTDTPPEQENEAPAEIPPEDQAL